MKQNLTYEEKKSIYEAVMKNMSKAVKKSLDNIPTEEFTDDDTHYSFSFNRGLGVQKAIGAKVGPLGIDKTFGGDIYISGPDHDTVMLYIYSIIMTAQWKNLFNIKINFTCSEELNNELMQWRKQNAGNKEYERLEAYICWNCFLDDYKSSIKDEKEFMERLKACLKKDGVVDFDYKLNIDIKGINPLKLA